MSPPNQPHKKLLEAVVHRATFDSDFRRTLLSAPELALQAAFGVQVPADFRVRFIEKDPGLDVLIVLPDLKRTDEELTDDDLDAVAGGNGGDPGDWEP